MWIPALICSYESDMQHYWSLWIHLSHQWQSSHQDINFTPKHGFLKATFQTQLQIRGAFTQYFSSNEYHKICFHGEIRNILFGCKQCSLFSRFAFRFLIDNYAVFKTERILKMTSFGGIFSCPFNSGTISKAPILFIQVLPISS